MRRGIASRFAVAVSRGMRGYFLAVLAIDVDDFLKIKKFPSDQLSIGLCTS